MTILSLNRLRKTYLNVTVKSKDRMQPSPRQPFHYYQILVVEKKYTHMSVGITDSDWAVPVPPPEFWVAFNSYLFIFSQGRFKD